MLVQPANSALPSDPPDPTSLSPDSLMAYCSTRLSSLDTQMQQIFDQQTQSASTINDLNNISGLLNDLPAPSTGNPPTITMSPAQGQQVLAAYNNAIDDLGTDQSSLSQMYLTGEATPLGAELAKDHGAFHDNVKIDSSGNWEIPASVVTNVTQNLKTYTSSLNSDAEMQMINLQSLMSSRQTAVELSTNMMQSMSTTDQSIASNFKTG